MLRKHTLYDFNTFMSQNMFCFIEYSVCSWQECVSCCYWVGCSANDSLIKLDEGIVQLVLLDPGWFFCLRVLSVTGRGVLKLPTTIMGSCVSLFSLVLFHLCILKLPPELHWGPARMSKLLEKIRRGKKKEPEKKIASHLCARHVCRFCPLSGVYLLMFTFRVLGELLSTFSPEF